MVHLFSLWAALCHVPGASTTCLYLDILRSFAAKVNLVVSALDACASTESFDSAVCM